VGYWRERLASLGLELGPGETRFGAEVIPFADPDGMDLELIVSDDPAIFRFWDEGPVPEEHALRGFHGVTLWLADVEKTARLLTEQLGYEFVGQEGDRYRYRGATDALGSFVDIQHQPGQPYAQFGAGSVHHIAFRAAGDEEQAAYQHQLAAASFGVTGVRDRQYFRSIYFRSPGGVLFEIATDEPGFAVDEPVGDLGQNLKLPPWLEPRRGDIERALPGFNLRPVASSMVAETPHA
jgi:glyoxalase family protein